MQPDAVVDDQQVAPPIAPRVAAREDGGPLAHLDQEARHGGDQGRLAAPADREVADRDHRANDTGATAGIRLSLTWT